MKFSDSPAFLQEYLDYIVTIKNRSELTAKNYYSDIRLFLRYLKRENGLVDSETEFSQIKIADVSEELIKSVTLETVLAFLSFALSERGNRSKARARKAVSLRRFFRYLTVNKHWFSVNPTENLEMPTPKPSLPKFLTVEQSRALLNACLPLKDWFGYRDYCILTFFLNCGMRLSELVGINIDGIHKVQENSYSVKLLGKGNKERIVYLNNACVEAWQNYLSVRPECKEKALFISKQHRRVSGRRVEQLLEEKLKLSGLSGMGFTVHKLRHTAATLMYQSGVDVRILQEILGHESLDTTQIYTHVVSEQVRQAVNKNPLADMKS